MDILGTALHDYFVKGTAETLWVHNSYGEDEVMPVDLFFRSEREMPDLELKALELCSGKVLDIGAGAGSHALILQERNFNVTALDISPTAVSIMKQRGVKCAVEQNIFELEASDYDTLLFMMNGIGVTGTIIGFTNFLQKAKTYLKPGGQLIFDSSDISYLYQEIQFPLNAYYGEVAFSYEYKQQRGKWFKWVYIDQTTLKNIAESNGWHCEIIMVDEHDQYLAQLKML
ncbi:class I SAM-dependent methyltransferase [Pedobacter sp.]|uniref:class I SAM-dependent methyltransferase n=1 Tax=Pedobacter sp. TaxID=1411316 RepID=UPI003D7F336F